jgi:hypothetical protein
MVWLHLQTPSSCLCNRSNGSNDLGCPKCLMFFLLSLIVQFGVSSNTRLENVTLCSSIKIYGTFRRIHYVGQGVRVSPRNQVSSKQRFSAPFWQTSTIRWMYLKVICSSGLQPHVLVTPFVRQDIIHQSKRNTGTTCTLNQLLSSHSRRFFPEMRCWHSRNKLNLLINRSEPH